MDPPSCVGTVISGPVREIRDLPLLPISLHQDPVGPTDPYRWSVGSSGAVADPIWQAWDTSEQGIVE
jgi:hypothetical protein